MSLKSRMLKGYRIIFVVLLLLVQTGGVFAFSDVQKESSFYVPIDYLKEHKLISGYSDNTFRPDNIVNRAEALSMIFSIAGINPENKDNEARHNVKSDSPIKITLDKETSVTIENLTTGESTVLPNIKTLQIETDKGTAKLKTGSGNSDKIFRDVTEKDWFYETVKKAKELGVVKGYNDGKYFKPKGSVNLAEVLRMLFLSTKTHTDIDKPVFPKNVASDAWYANDMAYALSRTILIQQNDGNVFPADKKLNRGQMALILYRFLKTKDGASFGYASWYGDGLAKTKLTENKDYAERHFTAAHKTLPFGTLLRVTNTTNGKYVDAVINDRGPFVTGRLVDLSKSAFSALDSPSVGVISVQVEVVK